jgi:hypothetical protein
MSFTRINLPSTISFMSIDTRTGPNKVIMLPAASTVTGRLFTIKDQFGGAALSTYRLSTIGMDKIDGRNWIYTFSNAFGAISFLSDGRVGWRVVGLYDGSQTAIPPAPPVSGLPLAATVRYSFLSTNYNNSGTISNIGSSTGIGTASVVGGTYTSAAPGFYTTAGGSQYIQAPSASFRTLIIIVRLRSTGYWSYLLDARNGVGSGYFASEVGPDWTNNSTLYRDTTNTAWSTNILLGWADSTWRHVAMVTNFTFTDDITFMARVSQNEACGGDIAEIMYFDTALTLQQVKDNYNFFASRFGKTPVA